MNRAEQIWRYLKKHNEITNFQISVLTGTTCPHSVIRDLRNKYGYQTIGDEWIEKTKKVKKDNGKEVKQSIRYKRYFLAKMA